MHEACHLPPHRDIAGVSALLPLPHQAPITAGGDGFGARSSRQQRFPGENALLTLSFKKKKKKGRKKKKVILEMSEVAMAALQLSGLLLSGLSGP